MSYWGAQVIISLFATIPWIGPDLAQWIRGDYVISGATLNRFFALHVIAMPLILLGLVVAHILALHEVGSNNPDGVDIKKNKDANGVPKDGIPFHPYYTVKDLAGAVVFFIVFFLIVFYMPEMGGYFLEPPNFKPADPLQTPAHIAPVWYFTPFYSILRAVPSIGGSAFPGVIAMGLSIVVLFFLPWIDRLENNPVRSTRYRSIWHKLLLASFVVALFVLGWLGTQPVTDLNKILGRVFTIVYFGFFIGLYLVSKFEKTRPVPDRVTH
jgi:ubiquinol-cytochrome c reductase cytochrome b subunit